MSRIRQLVAFFTDSSQNLNWMVFLFGILMYANLLPGGYTFGDELFGTDDNPLTSQGVSAIPDVFTEKGYGWFDFQPLTKASFALEYSLVGQHYLFSNFVQIVLFGITCLVLFLLINRLFPRVSPGLRFTAILLFVIHPVNSMVVNSQLGRADMLGLVFFGLGTLRLFRWQDSGRVKSILLAFFFFVLALLSNPQIMSWFLLPIFMLWINRVEGKSKIFGVFVCLMAAVFTYALFRVGNLSAPNVLVVYNPLVEIPNLIERVAPGLYVLLHGFKLLVVPKPLQSSYGYGYFEMVGWSNPLVYVSILILVMLLVTAFTARKRLPMLSVGSFIILIDLVPFSNVFFLQKTIFDEKSLFGASLGLCLIIVSLLGYLFKTKDTDSVKQLFAFNTSYKVVLLILLILGSYQTFSRNYTWINNYQLTVTDVGTAENCAIANYQAGKHLRVEYYNLSVPDIEAHIDSAALYLQKSIAIYDRWPVSIIELGELRLNDSDQPGLALQLFEKAALLEPNNAEVAMNIALALSKLGRTGEAIEACARVLKINPSNEMAMDQILLLYSGSGYFDEAEYVNQRYFQLHPESPRPYYHQAQILLSKNDTVRALDYLYEAKARSSNSEELDAVILKLQSAKIAN